MQVLGRGVALVRIALQRSFSNERFDVLEDGDFADADLVGDPLRTHEILGGNADGGIYAWDGLTGETLPGWPLSSVSYFRGSSAISLIIRRMDVRASTLSATMVPIRDLPTSSSALKPKWSHPKSLMNRIAPSGPQRRMTLLTP